MQAIRYHQYGGPETLRLESVPRPAPQEGEVLIHVRAAAANPVDWKIRSGSLRQAFEIAFPFTVGVDVAGVVEEIGESGAPVQPGSEVFAFLFTPRGGAFAEFAIAKTDEIAPKPKTLDFALSAAYPVAVLTAWQALFDAGNLQADQTVLIHGAAGAVGSMAVQLALLHGAKVIATASAADASYLRELGVAVVIDYRVERFEDHAAKVDLVFDTVGGDTLDRSFAVLRPGGALVSIAGFPSPAKAEQAGVRAQMINLAPNGLRLAEVARLIDDGKLKIRIDRVFSFAQALEALHYAESGRPKGKVVVTI